MKKNEGKDLLEEFRENEDLRGAFTHMLREMIGLVDPESRIGADPQAIDDPESQLDLVKIANEDRREKFTQCLQTVTNMYLAMRVNDNATRMGHWCNQDNESRIKGLDEYPIYWLTLKKIGCADPEGEVHLSIWASGPDMNAEEKAIRLWAKEHFGGYEIENLQQVRRGKFV